MDISILGYKFNLEVLILIGVVYLILVGHMFCGCCHFGMMEGFDGSGNMLSPDDKKKMEMTATNMATQAAAGGSTDPMPTTSASTGITVANSTEGVSGTNANLPPYLGINFIIKV
jgi:hypothetical protein